MKIILNDNYYITQEPYNRAVLVEHHVSAKGNDTEHRYYFQTIESALERFFRDVHAKKTEDVDGRIEEYYDAISKINEETLKEINKKVKVVLENG